MDAGEFDEYGAARDETESLAFGGSFLAANYTNITNDFYFYSC